MAMPPEGMPAAAAGAMLPPGMPAGAAMPPEGMPAAAPGAMPGAAMPGAAMPPAGMPAAASAPAGAAMPPAGMPAAASAPAATPTGAAGGVSATGDPHLVNVHGEHFDVMKPGAHVLLLVPFRANRSDALLVVDADAQLIGDACADTYFMSVSMTGTWVENKVKSFGLGGGHGLFFSAGTKAAGTGTPWMSFGKLSLKVRHGRTSSGTAYLNFFARNLRHTGHLIGGLLGEDDHTEVATLNSDCQKMLAL